jgi:hypothetical protein
MSARFVYVDRSTPLLFPEAVKAVEKRDEKGEAQGPIVYCVVEGQSHHRTARDLEKHEDPPELGAEAAVKEVIGRQLKTAEGKEIYKKRKKTVEPVFGIIKQEKRVPSVSAERA